MPQLQVKFTSEEARKFGLPKYAFKGDAGFDLRVILPESDREHGTTIFPGERKLLDAGIQISLPDDHWGRITHRSSTERRLRLRVVEGTIDSGYTGPIYVQVSNDNTFPIKVQHGDRIAQMIVCPVIQVGIVETNQLPSTDRGSKGFGSTGFGANKSSIGG